MTIQIQLIKYPPINRNQLEEITCSQFNNFHSLDSFDYNYINLNTKQILHYSTASNLFTKESDFKTLQTNLEDSYNCKNIIILPQNLNDSSYGEVKNKLNIIYTHIRRFYPLKQINLIFGKNKTTIKEKEFKADFYFNDLPNNCKVLTKNSNNKITSIEHENIIYTTLDFKSAEDFLTFIKFYKELHEGIEAPSWFNEVNMFDDFNQKQMIEKNIQKISELEKENKNAQEKLNENNEFKSILYKQSKPLEKIVKQMIEELLNCDLSEFEDVGHEDFLIKYDDVTFIGEIKGTKKNLINTHLSELDVHYSRRKDLIEGENLKPILIINRFMHIHPENRNPINHTQIKLAENKYKCLIIDSYDLLKLFEKFKNNEITTEEIKNKINERVGLFEP